MIEEKDRMEEYVGLGLGAGVRSGKSNRLTMSYILRRSC